MRVESLVETELNYGVNEKCSILGALRSVMRWWRLGVEAKRDCNEG